MAAIVVVITVQVVGLALVAALCVAVARSRSAALRPLRRRVAALGRHHGASVLVAGGAAFAVAAAISLIRLPVPGVHDEFSYLLAADTFAHGRLTNPTHPMWEHFESFHIIQQPTYMSKYPPAQGLMLALGQVLTGHPIVGVWISAGLAAGAVCWMLQGWVPGRWALLGAVLIVFHVSIQRFWGQIYWGGNVALIGGALCFGAMPRIFRSLRARHAVLMALGLIVLANSRPYEGLIASLPVAAALIVWIVGKSRPPLKSLAFRLLLPMVAVLLVGAAGMLYYNARGTGSALTMPYQVYSRTYGRVANFLWQSPCPEPVYRHDVMRRMHQHTWERAQACKTLRGFLSVRASDAFKVGLFFLGRAALVFTFLVPLLVLVWVRQSRRLLFPAAVLAFAVGASSLTSYLIHPHYLAAVVPLLVLLAVSGLRLIAAWRHGRGGAGAWVVRWLVCASVLGFLLAVAASAVSSPPRGWSDCRAAIVENLSRTPGDHLIIVRYGPDHNPFHEWVYNAADIDSAKVVWAREMGPAKDRELLEYFGDRRAWLLLADAKPPRMIPYETRADGHPATHCDDRDSAGNGGEPGPLSD